MAETNTPDILRGYTLVLTDGTRSYTVRLTEGSVSSTNGGHNIVRAQDTNGDFIGPGRQGAQAGVSTIAFTGWMFGTGGDATDVALTDLVHRAGLESSTWVAQTGITSDTKVKDYTATLTRADLASATSANASKGASYVWSGCIFQPGSSVEWTRDGIKISGTLESPNAYPTITQNV